MVSLKSIKWEYKISISFAVVSFLLSFFTGVITGNNFSAIIVKALLMAIIFAVMGYGLVYVLRKYVPEVFELPVSQQAEATEQEETSILDESEQISGEEGIESLESVEPVTSGAEFKPMGDSDFPKFEPSSSEQGAESGKTASMGRHVFEDDGVKYEPQLMAEAIRTMMNKDKE